MNQPKRTKGRGSSGFNRVRNRGPNTMHSHSFINSQNDDLRQSSVDIYQNTYLVHSIVSLLGCLVEVTVPNGTVYEGVLKTVSHKLDVTLEMAHITHKKSGQQKIEECVQVPSKECIIETLVIGLKNIVCIAAKDVDLEEIKKADNFTDTAISTRLNGQAGHERPLQKWEDPSGEHEEITGILEDSSMKNGLDPIEMFATNEKEHGVTSSYDHNMLCYTTPVEGSKELEDKAELLAREIEQENNYSGRNELDSGKTEEELFSAVVRASPAQGKTKIQATNSRDEHKGDTVPAKDLPTVSPPKPQRVPKERDTRLSDNVSKSTAVTDKSPSRDTDGNSVSAENEPKTETSTVKPVPRPQVESAAAESSTDLKQTKKKTPREEPKEKQAENVKDIKEDLKDFHSNFNLKLPGAEESNSEQAKKEPPSAASTQQPTPKEQSQSSTSEEEPPKQRDSPKVPEQQRSAETPPKTTEKAKSSFEWNVYAKEFTPGQSVAKQTPPVTPQQQQFSMSVAASPTPVRPGSYAPQVVQPVFMRSHPVKSPRSPFNPSGPRFFTGRDPADPHGSPGMSAAAATGNPIITQATYPHFLAPPFHGGMLQQMHPQGAFMLQPGPQGTQQHYVVPHSVGSSSVQSMAQSYQESPGGVPVYAGAIPLHPSSSFPGSPQPSPTTQGPFLQYIHQPVVQQQGSQPQMPQVLASPGQHPHVLMMQQQGGPQPLAVTGIPVSGAPGNPMMQQIIGPVGYSRKPQPPQWPHHQHPYPPSAT